MKDAIDPRLIEQVQQAGEEGEVEAVLLLADSSEPAEVSMTQDASQRLLERVSQQTQQQPTATRFMPNLGVLYVKGSGKFIRHLLDSDEVAAASANEGEATTAPHRPLPSR